MNRRHFMTGLAGILATGVAPAVVSASSIMRIKPVLTLGDYYEIDFRSSKSMRFVYYYEIDFKSSKSMRFVASLDDMTHVFESLYHRWVVQEGSSGLVVDTFEEACSAARIPNVWWDETMRNLFSQRKLTTNDNYQIRL